MFAPTLAVSVDVSGSVTTLDDLAWIGATTTRQPPAWGQDLPVIDAMQRTIGRVRPTAMGFAELHPDWQGLGPNQLDLL